MAALLLTTSTSGALAQSATESQVKAAFLYNFAKFVEWPPRAFAEAGAPLVIVILGHDPFGRDLDDMVRGRSAAGRPIAVHRQASKLTADVHVVFISASERPRLREILDRLKGTPVLTVSDIDDFTEAGGMIRMFAADGQIKFDINVEVAAHSGLQLSSKLLGAATAVRGHLSGR